MMRRRLFSCWVSGMLAALLSSCSPRIPYRYAPPDPPEGRIFREGEAQFEYGRPIKFVDGLGHYFFSLPAKLILWNWNVENHRISPKTEQALLQYLADNNLTNVMVRVNQYSPGGEFSRLFNNKTVGAGWRYTIGIISVLSYTIFPGRVFGGDAYNPYTNTIYLFSDVPAIAIHEGGHAKDFAEKKWKGSYAAVGLLPLISLWFEGEATGDSLGYFQEKQCKQVEKDAYKILYPAYFTYIGGEAVGIAGWFAPINSYLALAAVIPGHIAGRIKASNVDTGRDQCGMDLYENPPTYTYGEPIPVVELPSPEPMGQEESAGTEQEEKGTSL